ncbi:hypothetical protein Tco_0425914 [Tanacetum coccineum]
MQVVVLCSFFSEGSKHDVEESNNYIRIVKYQRRSKNQIRSRANVDVARWAYFHVQTGYLRNNSRFEQEDGTESEQEDGESNSESSKFETNYVSDSEKSGEESDENDDENKESSDNSSKENSFVDKARESKKFTEKDDRSIQQIRNFGTKKRLRQRPNRNTALESAIAPDSEDEMSSEKY